jgi:hypothetical protein
MGAVEFLEAVSDATLPQRVGKAPGAVLDVVLVEAAHVDVQGVQRAQRCVVPVQQRQRIELQPAVPALGIEFTGARSNGRRMRDGAAGSDQLAAMARIINVV